MLDFNLFWLFSTLLTNRLNCRGVLNYVFAQKGKIMLSLRWEVSDEQTLINFEISFPTRLDYLVTGDQNIHEDLMEYVKNFHQNKAFVRATTNFFEEVQPINFSYTPVVAEPLQP